MEKPKKTSLNRQVLALALPALGSLIAEPVLRMADSILVGHVGTPDLAGLAIGSTVLTLVVGICVFLAYTTTAVTGRAMGAGKRAEGLRLGIQGMWLGALLGAALAIVLIVFSPQIIGLFEAEPQVASLARRYLTVSAPGLVAMLSVLAANGVLRGLLDTRTPLVVTTSAAILNVPVSAFLIFGCSLGVAGAGAGTAICQFFMAIWLWIVVVKKLRAEGVSARPDLQLIFRSGMHGLPLVLRSLFLQAAIVVTTWQATRLGAVTLAGYQILKTLWTLAAFGLDALAIAAQALLANALGEGEERKTRVLIVQLNRWALGFGTLIGLVFAATSGFLPHLFTGDPELLAVCVPGIIVVGFMQPLAALTYIYDGYLIGADDTKYLAKAMAIVFAIYLPAVLLVGLLPEGAWGLAGLWAIYGLVFIGGRAASLWLRIRTDAWL
ncbi:MATE family efflux transporter [Varibaculum cambriense]|uniref:MATE family efflux transporter n=1 Tax=Varibaculum cambriense TaxID=184870 RepID=UPI0029071FCF|nr:MATE family efflux transporter [Varibaculum cambriense]MDU5541327.1 MATE family efflux transporter [Varibaculum cambriense]